MAEKPRFGGRHERPRRAARPRPAKTQFDAAELGALAHLYRGEVYRSTVWRTRLDQTTNWAVVTTGLAMSLTFSGPYASPLPLILVGLLVIVFLLLESRRYRYFNVWRARCRLMETDVYGPMLRGEGVSSTASGTAARRATTRSRTSTSATGGRSAGGCAATTPTSWRSRRSPTTASSRSTRRRRVPGLHARAAVGPLPAGSWCWPGWPSTAPGSSWRW